MKINSDMQRLLDISKDKMENKESEEFKNIMDKAMASMEEQELRDVCKQFESVFINMMLKSMRGTVQHSDLIPKSFDAEIFESMHDEKIAEEIANGQGVGIAQMLFEQLRNK